MPQDDRLTDEILLSRFRVVVPLGARIAEYSPPWHSLNQHSRLCLSSGQVVGAIRHKRANGQMDGEYKQLLGKLLRLHPDYYSMWNFRKEAVLAEVRARDTKLHRLCM